MSIPEKYVKERKMRKNAEPENEMKAAESTFQVS